MSQRDDELLASFVAGETEAEAPALRELFARRPELAELADELRSVRARLERDAGEERELIALARRETTAEDRTRVAFALRPRRSTWRGIGWARLVGLAAAMVALVGVAWYFGSRPAERSQVDLLGPGAEDGLRLLVPGQQLAPGVELRVDGASLQPNELFLLEVREPAPVGELGKLIAPALRWTSSTWIPSEADLAGWPDEVVVTVLRVARDLDDRVLERSPQQRLRVSR